MMVFDQGDQLPETAAAAIARAMWRYRSELAPIAFAALIVAAAEMLHRTHPVWWPWWALATVTTTTILAAPVPAWLRKAWPMVDRPAERVYVGAVIVMAGGWSTAATGTTEVALAPTPRRRSHLISHCKSEHRFGISVELRGFEPLAPSMRTRCATRLRYSPEKPEPA